MHVPTTAARLALVLAALAACSTPKEDEGRREASEARAPAPPKPWTPAFPGRAVLLAATVEIVGPRELIDHLAIAQDPENHAHRESATRDGMRIETTRLPGADGESPISAQIDQLRIAATERLVVLFSPGARQVTVSASGDVYYHAVETGEERRAAQLELVGAR
jgi:hypothetical protein